MLYRAIVTLINDDEDPSPLSVADLIQHQLRDFGLTEVVLVECYQTREDTQDDSDLYGRSCAPYQTPAPKPVPTGARRGGDRQPPTGPQSGRADA